MNYVARSTMILTIMLGCLEPLSFAEDGTPDIIGLKLGMTVEQANAQLRQYRPGIWISTRYLTEDRRWWNGSGIAPQSDAGMNAHHPFHDATLHVPIYIEAGYIEKAYTGPAYVAITDLTTPVEQFSGEFFTLFFTPTDLGGKLYAAVRHHVYISDRNNTLSAYAAAHIPLPQQKDLEAGALEKYGPPSTTKRERGYASLYWTYGPTGTIIPAQPRCASTFNGEDGALAASPLMARRREPIYKLWSGRKGGNLTLGELAAAFVEREFYKVKYGDSKTNLDEDVQKLSQIVPQMVSTHELPPQRSYHDEDYSQCGTQLHLVISPIGGVPSEGGRYASAMTISLSDQRAVFFDDGVTRYMEVRVSSEKPAVPPATKKEKF